MKTQGVAVGNQRSAPETMTKAGLDLLDERFPIIRDRLIRICRSVGGDGAEDAVQEAYLVARRTIGDLRDAKALDGWLTTIAVRRCIDGRRRERRLRERLPALFHRQQRTPQRDIALTELIERLPARHRAVTVLHYGYGYSLPEVANLLGLSHTNVRSIVMRARQRLYAAWQESNE